MSIGNHVVALLETSVLANHARPARTAVAAAALLKGGILFTLIGVAFAPGNIRVPWLPELPAPPVIFLQVTLVVWLAAAVLFGLGWRARLSGSLLGFCIAIVLFSDRQLYSNHLYLLLLLVLLLTIAQPSGIRPVGAKGTAAENARVPFWPLWLIAVQISVVYGYTALAKLRYTWFTGAVLQHALQSTAQGQFVSTLVGQGGLVAMAVATLVLELWLAVALWSRSRVRAAMFIGVAFHAGIVAMIEPRHDLAIFALLMLSGYTIFLAPMDAFRQHRRIASSPEVLVADR